MSKTDTRGFAKTKSKVKPKNKIKNGLANKGSSGKEAEKIDLTMTKEDEEILQNVEDEDGECDLDFNDEGGGNIDASEISGFLDQLGISKYQPFQVHQVDESTPQAKVSKKQKSLQVSNGDEVEIKEEPGEKKKKKKKKKTASENTEIKDESDMKDDPDVTDQSTESHKKRKSVLEHKVGKGKSSSEKVANGNVLEQEEKPDFKAIKAAMSYMKSSKSRSFLLLKSGELWREEKVYPVSKIGPEDKLVKEAEVLAERLLKDDIAHYSKQKENSKRSEARWLKTVLVSGTLSDKIAALTLLIQESPVHHVSSIDSLLSMAGKKGRREAMMAVDTLRDLFITGLLPDDRKLKFFHQFPLYNLFDMTSGNMDQRDKLLLCWYFEDALKKKYSQFIKILGEMLFDTLQATKEKAIKTIHHLLSSRPEQEHVLLPMLVNKIGDQQLNSKVSYLLGKLVEEHPNMKGVIVKEIYQLLYRPNISQRAQYYAICFLTQIRLSTDERKLATELIKIYLSFFKTFLKKKDVDSKTMSALLTGVNRAYVYASEEKSEILGQMNEVYKILPTVSFQTGVQALMLLYHVTGNDSNAATRFYSALYRKLNDPGLASTTKHTIFLNLLFKSMKRDNLDNRILAFIKRTLQVFSHHPAHVMCGVLILLSQVTNQKPGLLKLAGKTQVPWITSETSENGDEEDEEEKFVDLPLPEEFADAQKSSEEVEKADEEHTEQSKGTAVGPSVSSSWIHRSNKEGKNERVYYDPHHRNPLYSKAEMECIWELEELTRHFHPTVSLYASMLLKGESIQYNGDPLADYTLIRFLDRFVYKNPKKPTNQSGVGIPQQRAAFGIRKILVNSKEYLKQKVIPEDELFYFKYFSEKERQRKEKEDDEDSVDDDEFDNYMDKFIDGRKEDFGDLNLDFASDTKKSKSKGQKGETAENDESDEDEDDDGDDDMDFEDDELAAEFERELQGLEAKGEDGFNEEDVEFSSDEDDPLSSMMKKPGGKGKKRKHDDMFESFGREGKKKNKMDTADLFASAEEFSHLLEEGIESGSVSLGGSNQMMNQDKAAKKQIAWEENRDKWIKDKGKPFKQRRKSMGKPSIQGPARRMKPKSGNKAKFSKKTR